MTDDPTPGSFEELEPLFHEARALEGDERRRFLSSIEDEHGDLRTALERLLEADSTQDSLFAENSAGRLGWTDAAERIGSVRTGDTVGEFTVRDLIGSGGMGSVFAATQERPKRTVALKVLRGGTVSRTALRRFELESDILGTLAHPGIAQVYGAGLHAAADGVVPYLALERIDGKSITGDAADRGLSLEQKLEIIAVVSDAVEYAHRNGIIHRDLKPSNIMIDAAGRPRILDFGVARASDPDLRNRTLETRVGDIVGTLAYMSPEQASGDPRVVDTRSDVYALGVILFELVAGRQPHDLSGLALHDALTRVRETDAPPLDSVVPDVPVDVSTIVAKALAWDKERRYSSAAALAEDLRRYMASEPITARAASRVYQCRMFVRRNRLLVASAAMVVLALVGGMIGTLFGLGEAHQEAELARRQFERARVAARQYRGIVDFFNEALGAQDLLRFGRPVGSLRDFVDTIADEVDARFADDPQAEIVTRLTIGRAYTILRRFEEAKTHLDAALRLAEGRLGEGDSRTVEILVALGGLERQRHRFAASRTHLEHAESLLDAAGADATDRFFHEREMARLEFGLGENDRARDHVRRARSAARDDIPSVERWILGLLDVQLARHTMDLDRADTVLADLEDEIAAARGDQHPMLATVVLERADVALSREQWSRAEGLASRGVAIFRRAATGKKAFVHPHQDVLAQALFELGRIEEAETGIREVLDAHRKAGTAAIIQAPAHTLLARILARRGRRAEAVAAFDDLVARLDEETPQGSAAVAQALSDIAVRLDAMREPRRAEELARRAVDLDRKYSSPDRLVFSMSCLINALRAQGRFEELERLQVEHVGLAAATYGDDHTATLLYRADHGACLVILERYEEAVRNLDALERLEARELAPHHRRMLADLGLRYGAALGELDDFERAEARLLKTYDLSSTLDGPTHPRTSAAIRRLRILYDDFDEDEKLEAFLARVRRDRAGLD